MNFSNIVDQQDHKSVWNPTWTGYIRTMKCFPHFPGRRLDPTPQRLRGQELRRCSDGRAAPVPFSLGVDVSMSVAAPRLSRLRFFYCGLSWMAWASCSLDQVLWPSPQRPQCFFHADLFEFLQWPPAAKVVASMTITKKMKTLSLSGKCVFFFWLSKVNASYWTTLCVRRWWWYWLT